MRRKKLGCLHLSLEEIFRLIQQVLIQLKGSIYTGEVAVERHFYQISSLITYPLLKNKNFIFMNLWLEFMHSYSIYKELRKDMIHL